MNKTVMGSNPRKGRWSPSPRSRDTLAFLLFVAPAVLWFGFFMLRPLISVFTISLTDWTRLVRPGEFVGFENFQRFFEDPRFAQAFRNTLVHLVISLPGVIALAFFLGFYLSRRYRGSTFFRAVFFLPLVISVAAIAMIFRGLLAPTGIVNSLLDIVALDAWTQPWLGQRSTALLSVISVDFWAGVGLYAVLISAALIAVPDELYEAAEIDGASEWRQMRSIAFPYIKGFVGVVAMLHFLWILTGSAQNVLLLTSGGPTDASLTLGYYLYERAFLASSIAYSAAIGVLLLAIGVVGVVIIRTTFRRKF